MATPVGMDLGGRCSVGVRTVSLWPLGRFRSVLGLGSGTVLGAALVRSGAGGLVRWATLWHWLRLGRWLWLWIRRRIWLVRARIRRALLPVVWREPRLFQERQHQQHADHEYQ